MHTVLSTPTLSPRIKQLPEDGLVKMLNQGQSGEILDLALGVPSAPQTPEKLVSAACTALTQGHHQYEATNGNRRLRERIGASLKPPADPETELTITSGATEGLFAALLSVTTPGDEVIVFEPIYENFLKAAVLCGCIPRLVRTYPPNWEYKPDELEAAFNNRTRAIIVSTPNNPTGHMLSSDEWTHISSLCSKWNCAVISDEIYASFVHGSQEHISAADIPELQHRCFVAGSFSKSHAISGWRIGFLRADKRLTAAVRQIHAALTGGVAAPLQIALANAAINEADFATPKENLKPQRNRVINLFSSIGLSCYPPQGGCFLMADLDRLSYQTSDDFALDLLSKAQITIAPGRFFYQGDSGHGHRLVRIAFNRTLDFFDHIERRLRSFHTSSI